MSWLFSRNFADQKGVAQYTLSDERETPTTKTLPGKAIMQIWKSENEFYRQAKAKSSAPLNWLYKKC